MLAPTMTLGTAIGADASASSSQANGDVERRAIHAITMVSTMATLKPHTGEAGYAASKAALNVVTKYLALELGPNNIRVNVARMGWMMGAPVQGYFTHAAKEQGVPERQLYDAVAANVALRRIVTDDECARVALFLISDYASAVTGAVLDANGGESFP